MPLCAAFYRRRLLFSLQLRASVASFLSGESISLSLHFCIFEEETTLDGSSTLEWALSQWMSTFFTGVLAFPRAWEKPTWKILLLSARSLHGLVASALQCWLVFQINWTYMKNTIFLSMGDEFDATQLRRSSLFSTSRDASSIWIRQLESDWVYSAEERIGKGEICNRW